MAVENNGYRQLSWRLVVTLIGIISLIFIGVIGANYGGDFRRDDEIKCKVDKTLYERDRSEIVEWLKSIDEKIDVLIQK